MKENAQNYIERKLRALYSKFSGIKIRYEINALTGAHIIEVLPFSLFEDDQDYVLAEMEMEEEFEVLYGDKEEILFVSEDSLNQIESPIFQLGYDSMNLKLNLEDIFEGLNLTFSNIDTELKGKAESFTFDNNSYALAA